MPTTVVDELRPPKLTGVTRVARYRWWILAGLVVLYIAGFNGRWRLSPDSVMYANIARSIAEGQGFQHPMGVASRANPGLPYLISFSFRAFGDGEIAPVLVFETLCGIAVLWLAYKWIEVHGGGERAIVVAIMLGLSANLYRHSLEALNDVPFLVGVMLVIYGDERRRRGVGRLAINWLLIAAGFAWMSLFRIIVLLVAAAYLIALFIEMCRAGHVKRAVMVITGVLVVLIAVRLVDPRGLTLSHKESELLQKFRNIPATVANLAPANAHALFEDSTPTAIFGNRVGPAPLAYLPSAIILIAGIALFRRRPFWGLMVALSVVQWCLFMPDRRYFLPIQPLLVFAYLLMIEALIDKFSGLRGRALGTALFVVYFGLNTPRIAGFVVQQHRSHFESRYDGGQHIGILAFAQAVGQSVPSGGLVLADPMVVEPLVFFGRVRSLDYSRVSTIDPSKDTLYVVEPMDPSLISYLQSQKWSLGDALIVHERGAGKESWRLRPVLTSREPAPLAPATGPSGPDSPSSMPSTTLPSGGVTSGAQ